MENPEMNVDKPIPLKATPFMVKTEPMTDVIESENHHGIEPENHGMQPENNGTKSEHHGTKSEHHVTKSEHHHQTQGPMARYNIIGKPCGS